VLGVLTLAGAVHAQTAAGPASGAAAQVRAATAPAPAGRQRARNDGALPAGATPGGATPRAATDARVVAALEAAPLVVVAEVEGTRALGGSAQLATLRVEHALRGALDGGEAVDVAWEELAASRAPRLQRGERVLLGLEALGGASIWRSRLPDPHQRSRTLAIALRGGAFVRSPGAAATSSLEHYLSLPATERSGTRGVARLADIAASAAPPLAASALRRLAGVPDLDAALTPEAAATIARVLVRADRNETLTRALLSLCAQRRPQALRAPLIEIVARGPERDAATTALRALAGIDGALDAQRSRELLGSASPERRRIGARHASGPTAAARLETVLRNEPEAAVREAAAARLPELLRSDAVPALADALADPAPRVRIAAARGLAALGDDALPALRRVAAGKGDPARAAVMALSLAGTPASSSALRDIARDHPDPTLRRLAAVALGGDFAPAH